MVKLFHRSSFSFLLVAAIGTSAVEDSLDLERGFADPPALARSETWWHWMNGNVSKSGITADLEAMRSVGLGGAQVFDVQGDAPAGPVAFASETWFDHLLWAHREALRLGLRLTLHNSSGYAVAGGPWIRPEESMKRVAWTTTEIVGPKMWENEVVPRPADALGFYRDIAVLAVRKPKGMRSLRQDGRAAVCESRKSGSSSRQVWAFEFSSQAQFAVREVKYTLICPQIWGARGSLLVERAAEGSGWQKVFEDEEITVCYGGDVSELPHVRRFAPVTSDRYRVTISVPSACEVADVDLGSFATYGDLSKRTYRVGGQPPVDDHETEADEIVRETDIVDLTDRLGADGRLWWRVPEGRWQILRFGEVSTGKTVSPATYAGRGLETDKFSARATRKHFDAYLGKAAKALGIDPASDPWTRSGFVSALIDSYEAGGQNWGENFADEFAARRGYRIDGKKMIVYAGYILESRANTDRIAGDLRTTFGELFAEKFSDVFADCCKKAGLLYAVEPYDGQACSSADYARNADLPMCEFWYRGAPYEPDWSVRDVVAIARRNGQRIIGAESFTAWPTSAWCVYPYDFKSLGDIAYAMGVNRIVFHTFAHQPWANPTRYPGMCMTGWGSHFDRTETWWPYFSGWLKYQSRAQFLLQAGEFADDARVSDDKDVRAQHRRYRGGVDAWFVANAKESENKRVCTFPTEGRVPELWDAETGRIAAAAKWMSADGRTEVTIDFKPSGSVFVVFRKPTTVALAVPPVPPAIRECPVAGPWRVTFPVGWTTSKPRPKTVTFERLADWTANGDPDIRFFSGTATYETTVSLDGGLAGTSARLDLGDVRGIAEVCVNGKTLPFLWRPPYRVDITDALKGASSAKIAVKVTNNWKNRLIGDETLLAPDCEWERGNVLKSLPTFVAEGADAPSGRSTFLTFRHWRKGDALQSSGLLGPVKIIAEMR